MTNDMTIDMATEHERLADLATSAIRAVLLGGGEALSVYSSPFDVDYKTDATPVTEADRRSDSAIASVLHTGSPQIPILSEESAAAPYETRASWDVFWLVDPLDGTKEFVKRNGEFTINVALVVAASPKADAGRNARLKTQWLSSGGTPGADGSPPPAARRYAGEPNTAASSPQAGEPGNGGSPSSQAGRQTRMSDGPESSPRPGETPPGIDPFARTFVPAIGAVYAPVLKELFVGIVGVGAYRAEAVDPTDDLSWLALAARGAAIPQSTLQPDEARPYTIVASRSHLTAETQAYIDDCRTRHPNLETRSFGSSLKLCRVAQGAADEYPRFAPTMEWDTAAGDAVARAAGFRTRAWLPGHGAAGDLVYNKRDLRNPWFLVSRPDPPAAM